MGVRKSSVPRELYLQPHVFLCRGKRHWVILDVKRDKYFCVDRHQFELLGPALKGWVESANHGARGATSVASDAAELANSLLALDILSECSTSAKDALPTSYSLPTEAIDPDESVPSRRSSCTHALPFFASSAQASRELRQQRFQSTVELVRDRKNGMADRAGPFDIERTRSLVSVFNRLRWFYPRSYLCLFDSLALIHFLARFHVHPDWVFGVNPDPFEAHCWVQEGGVVLNDTVQRVSGFTPIMYI